MNILTKISIVVLVVLSIFGGVVFSRQAMVEPNYRQAYENETSQREIAELKARNSDLALGNAHTKIDKLQTALAQGTGELESTIKALNAELAEKNAMIDQLEDDFDQFTIQLNELNESLELALTERKLTSEQMAGLDAKFDRTQAEYTATQNDLAAAHAQIERDSGEKRVLREQIVHHEEEIERLVSKVKELGGEVTVADVAVYSAAKLTATITAVQGDGLASINIGKIGGVREGMVMFVYRGSDFVGHLRIEEVDDNASAGVIFDVREGMSVLQNDRVTSKLE